MEAEVFNQLGQFFETRKFSKNDHLVATCYLGMRICQGYGVIANGKTYIYPKLADFLADMNEISNIGDMYNYFLPALAAINAHKAYCMYIDESTMKISANNN